MRDTTDLSTPEGALSNLYGQYRGRWSDRDTRHTLITRVVRGDWTAVGPDDESLENRSPNLIQVALEDTSEAASLLPSVRVKPSEGTPAAKKKAGIMEQIGASYLERSEIALLTIKSLMNLTGLGIHSWVVVPSKDGPRIEWRDPRTCFPEPDYTTLSAMRRCFFARDVYVTQLPVEYQAIFRDHYRDRNRKEVPADWKFTLLEYYTEEETIVAGIYENTAPNSLPGISLGRQNTNPSYVSVIFDVTPNEVGICPVVVGLRPTFDNEVRGQFDQVIPVLQAHIRLAALSLDYADQAVYSEMWVKDLIGPMSTGGGGFIQLGPNGAIGRVPPAVSSLSVYQELQQLMDNFHIGARWPKVRPGEVDQAIASAKFVEATAGMMNTAIRTYHLILTESFGKALRLCFEYDKLYGSDRSIAGVHKNQQFLIARNLDDIDTKAHVRVEYGLGLGRDPAQSMVLGIQASQAGFVSREFVQENFEGITDVGLERVRMDLQQLQDMVMAKLLQGLQDGSIPPEAVSEIAKARENGDNIFELFDKFVVKAQQEAMAQMVPTMGGPMPPGPDAQAGQPPPAPPDPAALLGMLAGGGPPPESMSRLSTPAGGPGSFAGTTSSSGGAP